MDQMMLISKARIANSEYYHASVMAFGIGLFSSIYIVFAIIVAAAVTDPAYKWIAPMLIALEMLSAVIVIFSLLKQKNTHFHGWVLKIYWLFQLTTFPIGFALHVAMKDTMTVRSIFP